MVKPSSLSARTGGFGKWAVAFLIVGSTAYAEAGGRLIATGGVSQVEGAAGGGLTPWALIAGYGTRDEIDATAFYTHVDITDFTLQSVGAAVGFWDRFELSLARQRFDLGTTVPGKSINQDILGAKWRIAGDAVFDQDRWLPQIALGAQYKHNLDFDLVPKSLGAKHDSGIDVYLAATKLYLAGLAGRNVLLNGTVRATKANQMGLLGFGGDLNDSYQLRFEGSAAVFINDRLAVGTEYRAKPNNLSAFQEDSYKDIFIAYVPNKHVSFTAAYASLGTMTDKKDQNAVYLSIQGNF